MRVAVIGLGSIGRRHTRVIHSQYPEFGLVSVRSGHGAPCSEDQLFERQFSTIEDAINYGINLAIICSPATLHANHALYCINADVPVLIEKPLTANIDDALRFCENSKLPARAMHSSLVGYILRYEPAFAMLTSFINDGNFGEFRGAWIEARSYLPDWRPGQDYRNTVSARHDLGGGVLRELSHEIDYGMELFGPFEKVIGIRNKVTSIGVAVDEQVQIMAANKTGMAVSIYLDFASRVPTRRMRAWFEGGEITWDLMAQTLTTTDVKGNIDEKATFIDRDMLFVIQFNHFLDCVAGKVQPMCSVEEGIKVIKVIDAVEKSFITGKFEFV